MCQILAYGWQTTPKRGVVKVTWPIFYFHARNCISGRAEATVAKFLYAGTVYQMGHWDDRLAPNGRGQGHVTRF